MGVAAAAPATELGRLLTDDLGTTGGTNITAMTLWSWSQIYGAPLADVVTQQGMSAMGTLAGKCIERYFDVMTRRGPSKALARSFLKVDNIWDIEPWRSLLRTNTPGTLPTTVPVFLAQGTDDTLVLPAVTQSYMQELCKAGIAVQWYPDGKADADGAATGQNVSRKQKAQRLEGLQGDSWPRSRKHLRRTPKKRSREFLVSCALSRATCPLLSPFGLSAERSLNKTTHR